MPSAKLKTENSKTRPYFENLDSLRFFAFLLVFIFHAFQEFSFLYTSKSTKIFYALVTLNGQAGGLGVKFFFVLSGFLITYLILFEIKKNGNINTGNFYVRRMLRIWPLYFAAVFIAFTFFQEQPKRLTNYLLFLGNMDQLWNGLCHTKVLGVLWSISIEEQFYIFWPLIFLLTRKPMPVIIGLLFASLAFVYFHRAEKHTNYFHSISNSSNLIAGSILAWLCFYSKRMQDIIKHLETPVIISIYSAGFLMIYFAFYTFRFPVSIPFYHILSAFFFGFIIIEQNFSDNSFIKFGSIPLTTYLGKISYGLYIIHPIGIYFTNLILVTDFSYGMFAVKFFLSLLLTIVMAGLSYRFFEKPFLKLKNRFNSKQAVPQKAPI